MVTKQHNFDTYFYLLSSFNIVIDSSCNILWNDVWPYFQLEAAIQKEKERHAKELQGLENRLKESFVMVR